MLPISSLKKNSVLDLHNHSQTQSNLLHKIGRSELQTGDSDLEQPREPKRPTIRLDHCRKNRSIRGGIRFVDGVHLAGLLIGGHLFPATTFDTLIPVLIERRHQLPGHVLRVQIVHVVVGQRLAETGPREPIEVQIQQLDEEAGAQLGALVFLLGVVAVAWGLIWEDLHQRYQTNQRVLQRVTDELVLVKDDRFAGSDRVLPVGVLHGFRSHLDDAEEGFQEPEDEDRSRASDTVLPEEVV